MSLTIPVATLAEPDSEEESEANEGGEDGRVKNELSNSNFHVDDSKVMAPALLAGNEALDFESIDKEDLKRITQLDYWGAMHFSAGKLDKAEPYLKECLETSQQLLGEMHEYTLETMAKLASLFVKQERYSEGKCLHEECWSKRKESLGETHRHTLESMRQLASTLLSLEEVDEAQKLNAKYLEISSTSHTTQASVGPGDNELMQASRLDAIGSAYLTQRRYEKAEPYLEECLSKRMTLLGEKHADTLKSMSALAFLYVDQGQYDKAEILSKNCLLQRKATLGENHPDTLESMSCLAALYVKQKKLEQAHELHEEYLDRIKLMTSQVEDPKTKSKANDSFPKVGVSLSFLVGEFIDKVCGGREALIGMTTTEVCEQIIKPKTQEQRISYCDLLRSERHPGYAETAAVFVSHAHQLEFLQVINALESNLQSDTVVWFDIFSINQHEGHQWTFEWLSTAFMRAIKSFGRTVMVMLPWYAPLPFQRLWCIFEIFCTAFSKAQFDIVMSDTEKAQFLKDIRDDPDRRINQMLATIRAEKAECSVERDRDNIISAIQRTVGFAKINSIVFEKYRDWVIQVSIDSLESPNMEDCDMLDGLNTVGALYLGQGKYREAEAYLSECFTKRKNHLGLDNPDTLKSMDSLAFAYANQGQLNKARKMVEECLSRRKACLGEDHPDTLGCIDRLAMLYQSEGRFEAAGSLYDECLARRLATLGESDPDTLASMDSLASLYVAKAQYDLAEPLYQECLIKRKKEYGKTHPYTLTSIHNMAQLFDKQGLHFKAKSLYELCLSKRKTILGEEHPSTLNTMDDLASLYCRLGKHSRARPLFEICLEKRTLLLGDLHPDTLSSMGNLAGLYQTMSEQEKSKHLYRKCLDNLEEYLDQQLNRLDDSTPSILEMMDRLAGLHLKQGDLSKARELYDSCLEKRTSVLGSDHPDTLRSMANLSLLLYRIRDYETSKSLVEDCLARRKRVLGDGHPDTLESTHFIALWYDSQRKYDEAEPFYNDCLAKRKERLGDDHPDTLLTMNNFSVLLLRQGCTERAREMFAECLNKRQSLYGDYNPYPNQVHPEDIMPLLESAYTYESQEDFWRG